MLHCFGNWLLLQRKMSFFLWVCNLPVQYPGVDPFHIFCVIKIGQLVEIGETRLGILIQLKTDRMKDLFLRQEVNPGRRGSFRESCHSIFYGPRSSTLSSWRSYRRTCVRTPVSRINRLVVKRPQRPSQGAKLIGWVANPSMNVSPNVDYITG